MRAADHHDLEMFDHACLRRILKVRGTDRLSNDAVRDRCKMSHVDDILVTRRLCCRPTPRL